MYRNTPRIGYLDRPITFFALVLCSSAEEKEEDRNEQSQEQKTKGRNEKELQGDVVCGSYLQQLTSSTRNGGSAEAASRSEPANITRHTDLSRGDQEHSSSRKSTRSSLVECISEDSGNSSGTKRSIAGSTCSSPAERSDDNGRDRSKLREGSEGKETW